MSIKTNYPDYAYTITAPETQLEYQTFKQLKDNWLIETTHFSDPTEIFSNEHYQKIINFGYKALFYILSDLEDTHNHWFHALYQITGFDAVRDENRGDIAAMSGDWIRWKKEKQPVSSSYDWPATFSS